MISVHSVAWCLAVLAASTGCTESGKTTPAQAADREDTRPAIVNAPRDGLDLWWMPTNQNDVGDGAEIKIKIDAVSAPGTSMMVATQTLAADGIPLHLHTFEEEVLYVVKGRGTVIVGDGEEVPVEPGSLLYVPQGNWHGVRNSDPNDRLEVLMVTTPAGPRGLAEFFRETGVPPGHPPINLSDEEILARFKEYGMEIPQ